MSIFAVTLEARNRLTSGPPMLTRMPRPPSGGCFLIEATSKDGGGASDVCVAAGSDVWEADCAVADATCAGLEWTLRIGTAAAMQKAAENRRTVLILTNDRRVPRRLASARCFMATSCSQMRVSFTVVDDRSSKCDTEMARFVSRVHS